VITCTKCAKRPSRGFTLLELLVALAIFALIGALAYSGLSGVLETREQARHKAEQLAALQLAFSFIGRDLEQASARGVRDILGDSLPALRVTHDNALEFTRGGWRNPGGGARSHLQRVAYRLKDGKLLRLTWPVLDQAHTSAPQEAMLLSGVKAFEARFYDQALAVQTGWPVSTGKPLPRAVEISIEPEGFGRVTRLFRVADGT
jgi:general secretion pathway protein J